MINKNLKIRKFLLLGVEILYHVMRTTFLDRCVRATGQRFKMAAAVTDVAPRADRYNSFREI